MFAELHQVEADQFKAEVGLDADDFVDKDVQELLGVYDEVKLGLEDLEGDGEEGESEEDYDDEEESEEGNEDEKEESPANN